MPESRRALLEQLRAEQGAMAESPQITSRRAMLESLRAEQGPSGTSEFAGKSLQERGQLAQERLGPKQSLGNDIMTGVESGMRNYAGNIGIPGTEYDLGNALEKIGIARSKEEIAKDYEAAGPAAGVAKFGSEMLATAPIGGAVSGAVKGGMPFARTAKAAIEGAVAGGLTGEGDAVGDVAAGAVGGVVGDKLIRGFGRLGTGFENISDEAKRLIKNKMSVTIGQSQPDTFVGRGVRGVEDAASSIPFGVGDFVVAGKQSGIKDLRKKYIESALPPGMKAPSSSRNQPLKALQEIEAEYSKRYRSILDPKPKKFSADSGGKFSLGDELGGEIRGNIKNGEATIFSSRSSPYGATEAKEQSLKRRGFLRDSINTLKSKGVKSLRMNVQSTDMRAAVQRLLETGEIKNPREVVGGIPTVFDLGESTLGKIDPDRLVAVSLDDPSAPLPEDSIKFIEKRLRKAVNIKNATPQSLFDAQSTLRAEARELSSHPSSTRLDRAESKVYRKAADQILNSLEETNPGLKDLSWPYRNYETLRHEIEKGLGHGENLTIRQMQAASKKSGNKELQELTKDAGSILPSRTADSGTPKRAAQLALTGGAGAALFDPTMLTASAMALGLIAPGALATTQRGSKFLLGQYKGQENIRKLLGKYSATAGGMAGERASR